MITYLITVAVLGLCVRRLYPVWRENIRKFRTTRFPLIPSDAAKYFLHPTCRRARHLFDRINSYVDGFAKYVKDASAPARAADTVGVATAAPVLGVGGVDPESMRAEEKHFGDDAARSLQTKTFWMSSPSTAFFSMSSLKMIHGDVLVSKESGIFLSPSFLIIHTLLTPLRHTAVNR